MKHNHRTHGWSLIEVTIILIALSILASILAPNVGRYVRQARVVRAKEDTQMLSMAIWMFMHDTAHQCFLRDGSAGICAGASRGELGGSAPDIGCYNHVNMIVGNGDIPELGSNGDSRWASRYNGQEVDFMEYHLITNRPGNNPHRGYRTPRDLVKSEYHFPADPMFARVDSSGFNSMFAWRGPYISSSIDPDPWGNRYMANVQYLAQCDDFFNHDSYDMGYQYDVMVISAGSDEQVDTLYEIDGLIPGDDDIGALVSANGA